MAKFNCSTDQSLVTDRHGHLKKNWWRTLLREIELGHTLTLNVWENLELGENQWKMIKTLYYIEVLGYLSPLLTIFQLYHSAWSSVLLVEENGKNHRAGFELTTLVMIGTDCIDANHYDFSVISTNFGPKLRCYGQQSTCYGISIIASPEPFTI